MWCVLNVVFKGMFKPLMWMMFSTVLKERSTAVFHQDCSVNSTKGEIAVAYLGIFSAMDTAISTAIYLVQHFLKLIAPEWVRA